MSVATAPAARSFRGIPLAPRVGRLGVACALVIVGLAAMALLAPLVAPHDPDSLDLSHTFAGPSPQHLLGTDDTGRDLLSRVIFGSRTSLLGPLLVVSIEVALGSLLAIGSAWIGGVVDGVVSRVLDVLFAFPGILLAILATAVFGAGLRSAVIALAIAHMPFLARVTRAAALRERELPYVDALHVQGFSGFAICLRHIFPNLVPLIVAQATVSFGYVTVDLAAISFLGLGVQPPTADWGTMVAGGEPSILQGHPEAALYAGGMLVLTVCAFTILGERLAERGGTR
jgi:peptide/nickel transport system permease protein